MILQSPPSRMGVDMQMRIIIIRIPISTMRSSMRYPMSIGAASVCAAPFLAIPVVHAEEAAAESTESAHTDGALDAVVVQGVRPLISDKLPGDLQNTPQSVTVVPAELMTAQASTRLEDALKNVPGITLNAGEGAARGDTVNLRGFSAFNDFFLDGIRDAAVYTRDSFNLQSVEVLKGPSATLFGRGSTGSAINQVSKAPELTPLTAVAAEVGTNDEYRATADVEVPFSSTAAFRINAMGESSEVADRDYVKNRRWGVASCAELRHWARQLLHGSVSASAGEQCSRRRRAVRRRKACTRPAHGLLRTGLRYRDHTR